MNNSQTKPDERDTRSRQAFFDVESEVHNLRHMATIAADFLFNVGVSRRSPAGEITLEISYDEFERIQFAVGQTRDLADDLVKAFAKEFGGRRANDHDG